ncbi:MAG: FG-GAP-like repeat-containing protein [Ginsengibacter sp.]
MKKVLLPLIMIIAGIKFIPAQTPGLGIYPATSITTAGGNTTVIPSAPPTNTTSITAHTSTNFKGSLIANPATGVVRITDAHPAGTYTITVKAFNGVSTGTSTFTLTVNNSVYSPGLLTPTANMSAGGPPISVAIGDFNGDGKQDIASANSRPSKVSIRLGNGAGGFSGITEVSVGSGPFSVAIGDFNGDGKQDLATANVNSDNVSIRLGDGIGGFSGSTEVMAGATPISVVIGDFNGDGKSDFAVSNYYGNSVSIRLGNGAGSFTDAGEVAVGVQPRSVTIGDFNGDGKQDFATANETNTGTVSIRLGDGAGGFSGTTGVSVGNNPATVAIGDFNNDGKQDFAVSNHNGVSIRLGDGAGHFGGTTEVTKPGTSPFSLAIGDFNGDGKQDFTIGDYYSSTVSLGLGDGAGNFVGTANLSVPWPASLAIGDFNGDGMQDVAAANTSDNFASILLGSSGAGAPIVSITAPANNTTITGPVDITFTAIASDANGTITKVEFYNGTKLMATESYLKYSWTWKNSPVGKHKVTAKAYDNDGNVTTSAPVYVTVVPVNPSTVSIVYPLHNATYTSPADVRITAVASKTDGAISKVEFYNGATLLATERSLPYSWNWVNAPAGMHTLTAKAYYSSGPVRISDPVTITVNSSATLSRPAFATTKSDINSAVTLKLMPNPANNLLTIYTTGLQNNKQATLSIMSVSGALMKTKKINGLTGNIQLNVSSLARGTYTIKLISGDKIMYKKFVKL